MADWSNLPKELITKIVEHSELYEDFETFRFVCSNWRSAAKQAKFLSSINVPWLILPEDEASSTRLCLYSISSCKVRNVDLPLHSLTGWDDKRLFSSRGWLLSASDKGSNMSLFNPLSSSLIELPNALIYHQSMIEKVILSANPLATSDYIIAMLFAQPDPDQCYAYEIAFWSYNNGCQMASLYGYFRYSLHCYCCDICFYQGKCYGADSGGKVVEFDLSYASPKVRLVLDLTNVYIPRSVEYRAPPNVSGFYNGRSLYRYTFYYLVESGGQLLHVSRMIMWEDNDCYSTSFFLIVELNLDDGRARMVNDLGSRAIFVGSNSSFSVEASSTSGCEPNCVYYTDEHACHSSYKFRTQGKDIGVYNLSTREIRSLYDGIPSPVMWIESPSPLNPGSESIGT